MSWSFTICNTQDGTRLIDVEPAQLGSASRRLSGGFGGSTPFVLSDDSVLNDDSLTLPWARTLVRSWNGVPKYAGVITADPFDDDEQLLTLKHEDIETFIGGSRYPFGTTSYWANEPNHLPGSLEILAKSKRAAVGKVVEQGIVGTSAIYSLPIVLPSLSEGGAFSKVYPNYHFQSVGDIIADFRDLGLEIDFEPRWSPTTGKLEWVMRVGSDATPQLTGGLFEFNQTVPERRLTKVKYERDGIMQITGQFSVGEGMEIDMRVGGAGFAGAATIPARDGVAYFKTEADEPRLAAYSQAAILGRQFPTIQWEMSLLAGEEPGLENIRLGSVLRMFWQGNRRIPDGTHDVRVIGYTLGNDDSVTIDAQTVVA